MERPEVKRSTNKQPYNDLIWAYESSIRSGEDVSRFFAPSVSNPNDHIGLVSGCDVEGVVEAYEYRDRAVVRVKLSPNYEVEDDVVLPPMWFWVVKIDGSWKIYDSDTTDINPEALISHERSGCGLSKKSAFERSCSPDTIYVPGVQDKKPETALAVLSAVQQLIDALRAGKWPTELISNDLRDPSGELVQATRMRFLNLEDFEVDSITETDGYFTVSAAGRIDGDLVRIGMVLRREDGGIKLAATPLIGAYQKP